MKNKKTLMLWREIKKERIAYLFILPSYAMFIFFVLYPMLHSFFLSFQEANLVSSRWVGLKNYVSIFTDQIFHLALRNTFLFVIILVPLTVFLSFLVSYRISFYKPAAVTFFRASFYLPTVISGVIVSMIWIYIFDPAYGVLNYVIGLLGMEPVLWLGSKYTVYFLMIVVFTFSFGIPVIIYLAALNNVPNELYEAALIDGASMRTIKWRITFPLLKPTTFFLLVTRTIAAFQVWAVIYLMTNGGPAHQTETIVFQIYRNAFEFNMFGRASAMGMVLLIIVIIVSILQRKFAGQEISY